MNTEAEAVQPDTVYALFAATAERFSSRPALLYKQEGEYQTITYGQMMQAVAELAAGLAQRGVKPGDRVAIFSYNRPEWIITDFAVARLGAVLVPIYHTLPEDSVRYILNDAEAAVLVVETPELLTVVERVMSRVPALKTIVTLFAASGTTHQPGVEVESYESLRREGADALKREPLLAGPHPARPDDLFTLCYTSGTTGEPKGAMLTNANILSNVTTAIRLFSITENDVLVSFLPLCHMFERTCGHYTVLLAGGAVAYAESVQTVAADVQKVRPTIMIVVPRVLEKVYATVQERVLAGPWHKRQLMIATLRTYSQYGRLKARRRIGAWLAFKHWLLGRLVVSKLVRLGGGRLRLLVSGSAPLERRLARTIRNLGFNLLEGYGLTETSPVACAQVPGEEVVGTVGRPFDGVEVRVGASDEVLIRGPNVMRGYFKKPEETAKAIDCDGWLHTGDQGRFDEKGNLVITGRLKEIIVTSYGKNLAPVPIELALAGSKYIEQAVVHGDRRPFLVALIVPARLALESFARESGIACKELSELLDHPRVLELYAGEVGRALTGFAQYEQVRKFRLITEPFTVENGLLTPSLKVRRPCVVTAYRDEIDKLYA